MKFVFTILCICTGLVYAQSKVPAAFNTITYRINRQNQKPSGGKLYLYPASSVWVDTSAIGRGNETIEYASDFFHRYQYEVIKDPQGFWVKSSLDGSKKSSINLIVDETFTVDESSAPAIKWALLPEKKTIQKFPSKKAVGSFRGRTWEVWYTDQLPMPLGPWELAGLPGLIVKAQDTTQKYSFTISALLTDKNIPLLEYFISEGKELTYGEYWDLLAKYKASQKAKQTGQIDPTLLEELQKQYPGAPISVESVTYDENFGIEIKKD